jgi:hypothetical protein
LWTTRRGPITITLLCRTTGGGVRYTTGAGVITTGGGVDHRRGLIHDGRRRWRVDHRGRGDHRAGEERVEDDRDPDAHSHAGENGRRGVAAGPPGRAGSGRDGQDQRGDQHLLHGCLLWHS